ncbi:uncharacterized protein [Haliotis asinina]|uniref:uncharacterized protein n=1 Tax=Haliotis asinina TaxID=109174 RepID=UPI0035319CD2
MRTVLVITLCLLPCLISGMYQTRSLYGGRGSSGLGRTRILTIPDGTPDYQQVVQTPTGGLYQIEDRKTHLIGGRLRTSLQLENYDRPDPVDGILLGGSPYVGGSSFGGLQSLLGGNVGGSVYGNRLSRQPSLFSRVRRY